MVTTQRRERILVVEPDPTIADLVARQSLQPMHYRVKVVGEAGAALQMRARFAPHLIITDLRLPGLSGKDLLAALRAPGDDTPIIVIAEKGAEPDIISAFRLGAADFLLWPMQETEVVSAVERVLRQVRERRAKARLAQELQKVNQELQRRVRELTTLAELAKATAASTTPKALYRQLVAGAIQLAQADKGWLSLRTERDHKLILTAQKGLPRSLARKVGQPWDDGLGSLVALSGEPLALAGQPLRRFKIHPLGQAALVVPVKAKNEVVALLTVMRSDPRPFSADEQALLQAVADYVSMAVVRGRLFRALEARAQALQRTARAAREGERLKNELLQRLNQAVLPLLEQAQQSLRGMKNPEIQAAAQRLRQAREILASVTTLQQITLAPGPWKWLDLNALAQAEVGRFEPRAQQAGLQLALHTPDKAVVIHGDPHQLSIVFEQLLNNALKFTPRGGKVTVTITAQEQRAHVAVSDTGIGIAADDQAHVFTPFYRSAQSGDAVHWGVGLSVVQEIIATHGGKVWVESSPGQGATFHFTLPLSPP